MPDLAPLVANHVVTLFTCHTAFAAAAKAATEGDGGNVDYFGFMAKGVALLVKMHLIWPS